MKKYIHALLCAGFLSVFVPFAGAQTTQQKAEAILKESDQQAKTLVRTLNDIKTGNWQDVLTSFFQVAVNDLTGKDRTVGFKANLFALKAKADSTLLVDTNFIKHRIDRNFQFEFSLKLDSKYHFNAFKAGFNWAIINKRDSSLLSLIGTKADEAFQVGSLALSVGLVKFEATLIDTNRHFKSEKDSLLYLKTSNIIDSLMALGPKYFIKSSVFPKEFVAVTDFETIQKNYAIVDSVFNAELAKMRQAPLLTLSANGLFDRDPGFIKEGTAELVFLQGLTKKGRTLELDVRASASLVDTLVNNIQNRIVFDAKGGCNWAMITSPKDRKKTIVEFKPHFEYRRVARGVYANEEATQFSANAELRVRITDNLWFPLTLKYDIENSNFLGFLNVSLNMNAFKKPAK
jgi:hypothetical protein